MSRASNHLSAMATDFQSCKANLSKCDKKNFFDTVSQVVALGDKPSVAKTTLVAKYIQARMEARQLTRSNLIEVRSLDSALGTKKCL